MKKLFLLPVLFFLVLNSCKDEEPAPWSLAKELKGSWTTVNQEYEYIDDTGQLVHQEKDDTETVFTFDGGKYKIEYADGSTDQGTYTLRKIAAAEFIALFSNGRRDEFQVWYFEEPEMKWKGRLEDVPYDAGSTVEMSDYAIVSVEFKRK